PVAPNVLSVPYYPESREPHVMSPFPRRLPCRSTCRRARAGRPPYSAGDDAVFRAERRPGGRARALPPPHDPGHVLLHGLGGRVGLIHGLAVARPLPGRGRRVPPRRRGAATGHRELFRGVGP